MNRITMKSWLNRVWKQIDNRPLKQRQTFRTVKLNVEQLESRDVPSAFTAGNIAVLDLAAASTNTTGSILELNPLTANQSSPVQTVSIASTGANALRFSNSGTSSFLSDTNDRTLLAFGAYNTTDSSTADLSNTTTSDRAVGTLGGDAGFTLQTTYTGIAANQDRSATSLNNTNWFIADKGGLYTNNATTPSLSTNILVTKSFGGTVYVASTAATAAAVSTVSSPTASSLTGLPGLTIGADTKIQDFYLVQSGSSGANYDLLYTLDSTSKLNKFSLVGGSWTANGTYTLPSAGLALIAANNGSGGTYLYDTTATKLLEFHDTAGYNATINITTANNVTLYTATGTNVLKGLDFVPQANVATTTAITSVSPTTQAVGSPVTFTGTVTAGSGAAPTTGTVYFYNGGTSGTLLATATTANETTSGAVGTFTVSTSSLAPGTYSNIQAFYVAGTGFISGNSAVYGSSLTISGPTAPTITSGTNTAFTAGQSNTFSVTASGTPTITFTETGALPNGVTLTSAGVLSGNPAAVAQTTAYPITITAHNSGSPDATQAFTLYELPAASTPVAFTPGNILVYRVGDGGTTYGSAGTGGSTAAWPRKSSSMSTSLPASSSRASQSRQPLRAAASPPWTALARAPTGC